MKIDNLIQRYKKKYNKLYGVSPAKICNILEKSNIITTDQKLDWHYSIKEIENFIKNYK